MPRHGVWLKPEQGEIADVAGSADVELLAGWRVDIHLVIDAVRLVIPDVVEAQEDLLFAAAPGVALSASACSGSPRGVSGAVVSARRVSSAARLA
jgi:hypothetical protein